MQSDALASAKIKAEQKKKSAGERANQLCSAGVVAVDWGTESTLSLSMWVLPVDLHWPSIARCHGLLPRGLFRVSWPIVGGGRVWFGVGLRLGSVSSSPRVIVVVTVPKK